MKNIQYSNLFKSINSYLYEYHCLMTIIDDRTLTKTITIKNGHRKTKKEYSSHEYLIVEGNGMEKICSVRMENGKYCIYKGILAWYENEKPYLVFDNESDAETAIEEICRKHYHEKYGEMESFVEYLPGRKRLSIGEICDWYNEFRKLGMSIIDIQVMIEQNKKMKKDLDYYENLLDTVSQRVNTRKRKKQLGETKDV